MIKKFTVLLACSFSLLTTHSFSGENFSDKNSTQINESVKSTYSETTTLLQSRSYTATSMEGHILSTSTLTKSGTSVGLTTPRFTTFLHIGVNYHYDFSNSVGIITGLGIRNIGFIEKLSMNDSTVKRRIYGLTVPGIFKFGDMPNRQFFFAGAELTMAFNYKEKGYVKRNDKDKFNEWFSKRTPLFHPSITAGYQMKYGYIKFNYYVNNFLNTQYVDKNSMKPYENYEVNLITMTFGFNLPHTSKFYDIPTFSAFK